MRLIVALLLLNLACVGLQNIVAVNAFGGDAQRWRLASDQPIDGTCIGFRICQIEVKKVRASHRVVIGKTRFDKLSPLEQQIVRAVLRSSGSDIETIVGTKNFVFPVCIFRLERGGESLVPIVALMPDDAKQMTEHFSAWYEKRLAEERDLAQYQEQLAIQMEQIRIQRAAVREMGAAVREMERQTWAQEDIARELGKLRTSTLYDFRPSLPK